MYFSVRTIQQCTFVNSLHKVQFHSLGFAVYLTEQTVTILVGFSTHNRPMKDYLHLSVKQLDLVNEGLTFLCTKNCVCGKPKKNFLSHLVIDKFYHDLLNIYRQIDLSL